MKRLALLLLALFCASVVQVRPVDGLTARNKACGGCCQVPGACGMPACCPPAVSMPAFSSPAPIVRSARVRARRAAPPVGGPVEKFYASFVEPAAASPALPSAVQAAPTATVPLFKAHCSFLI